MMSSKTQDAGFTLAEVLIAFSLLLVGMTGIIGMFSAGLRLDRAGSLAMDGSVVLDELRPQVIDELRKRAQANPTGELELSRREVPGTPGMEYYARAIPLSEPADGSGYMMNIFVVPAGREEIDAFSFGWLPVRLRARFDELIDAAEDDTDSGQKRRSR